MRLYNSPNPVPNHAIFVRTTYYDLIIKLNLDIQLKYYFNVLSFARHRAGPAQ